MHAAVEHTRQAVPGQQAKSCTLPSRAEGNASQPRAQAPESSDARKTGAKRKGCTGMHGDFRGKSFEVVLPGRIQPEQLQNSQTAGCRSVSMGKDLAITKSQTSAGVHKHAEQNKTSLVRCMQTARYIGSAFPASLEKKSQVGRKDRSKIHLGYCGSHPELQGRIPKYSLSAARVDHVLLSSCRETLSGL